MALSEVEIEVADLVTVDIVAPRTAWILGQPITAGLCLRNAGDPAVRGVLRRFLAESGLHSPFELPGHEDLPTSLRSCAAGPGAAIYALTHFGLEPLRRPTVRLRQPFPKVRAAYLLNTASERLTAWPYRTADGWVTGVLPDVTTTTLVVLVGQRGAPVPLVRRAGPTLRVDWRTTWAKRWRAPSSCGPPRDGKSRQRVCPCTSQAAAAGGWDSP